MKPALLFLTHRVPYPPNRGDRIRSYNLLRFLARRYRVYLACLSDEPANNESLCALEELCEALAVAPLGRVARWLRATATLARGGPATTGLFQSPRLRRTVERWCHANQFDCVVAFCSSMAQYMEAAEHQNARSVIDLVDVDSQKWFDYASSSSGLKRWLFNLEGRRVRQLESRLAADGRAIAVVSPDEAELLGSFAPCANVTAIPNGVDTEYFDGNSPSPGSESAVFVGALNYRANIGGLQWFCENVWPQVLTKHPHAHFRIVGLQPVEAVRRLVRVPGVEIVGEVPDVRPYLRQSTLVVAPLQVARGLQNKVLEALAMSKPVVASPQALTGLRLEAGRHAVCAETAPQWIDRISELFTDPARCQDLGQSGRYYVLQHHSWDRCLEPLAGLLQEDHPSLATTGATIADS